MSNNRLMRKLLLLEYLLLAYRLSKLGLHTVSTGLIVLFFWFGLCSAISFLTPGNAKTGRQPTPIVSPILVTTLVFGLGVQIHPSVSATLGPMVDNIPEIATTGCVLSAGRISFVHKLNRRIVLNFAYTIFFRLMIQELRQ